MSDIHDEFAISEDEEKAYMSADSRCMSPPDSAETKRKYTSWNETFIIRDVTLETERILKVPERPDDQVCGVTLQLEVDPLSVTEDGTTSGNVGYVHYERLRFNLSAWRRAPRSREGQAIMTSMSFNTIQSLLQSFDMDPKLGMNISHLVSEIGPTLLGHKAVGVVSQNVSGNGQLQDQVRTFLPVPVEA